MEALAVAAMAAILVATSLMGADALQFELPHASHASKCLSEEIQSNVLVLAEYSLAHGQPGDLKISARLMSPYGNSLHFQENVSSSQFSFTTKESGSYSACFWVSSGAQPGQTATVELDWKMGIMAKDWLSIARKDKVEGVELELMKLQGLVDSIRENLLYLKEQEKVMREVSEGTNGRVAWFSIASLTVCVVVAVWQLWHLRSFFERKKLL